MTMRVATFHHTSSILQTSLTTQAKLANVQQQQASGLKSSDYAGLGTDTSSVIDLSVSIERSKASINSAEQAKVRTEMMDSTLGYMNDLLTNMRADVNAASTESDLADLQTQAQATLEEFTALANTEYGGRYLFSGGATDTKPVDLDSYAATDLTSVNTDYYQGDDYVQSARLGPDQSIEYGITADNEGFEQALRALSYLATADPLETSDLEEASNLLVSAQESLITAQSQTGGATNRLESFIETESYFVATSEGLATDLTSVDIGAVTVEATMLQTQLEANYSALSVSLKLSLVDYLQL